MPTESAGPRASRRQIPWPGGPSPAGGAGSMDRPEEMAKVADNATGLNNQYTDRPFTLGYPTKF